MKILVIGDSCYDIFRYGTVTRLAPEAPVPVINPTHETSNLGMAGNVVKNIEALGYKVDFITNTTDIKKIRYVCSKYNQLILRVDENDKCDRITQDVLDKIIWREYDAIVISDYCKGFLTETDVEFICSKHKTVFLDTKKILGWYANNVKFIKINHNEYLNNENILNENHMLLNKTIITKGKYGCEYQGKIFPTEEVPVKDISGAGDTFLAGLVVEFLRTKNIIQAIDFAQECTTLVVQKSGVSTI
jgi:D-beta-D-heptose 7-phosphate kinase/D-beta-D-heptose 1-phosphate adenosyltransferase